MTVIQCLAKHTLEVRLEIFHEGHSLCNAYVIGDHV